MKYYLLNVFTKDGGSGNQLAVVFPNRDLSQEEMQGIAREFNFSETVFHSQSDPKTIRIFTPLNELVFAGHPTIGAGWLIDHLGLHKRQFALHTLLGEVEVEVGSETYITFPGDPTVRPYDGDLETLLREANVELTDTDFEKIRMVNVGPEFTVIPVTTRAALSQAVPPVNMTEKNIKCYLIYRVDEAHLAVRMFAPGIGIPEDSATGSAACALGGYLRAFLKLPEGFVTITQGTEMGRECELQLRWKEKIQVGGQVKLWGEGTLYL